MNKQDIQENIVLIVEDSQTLASTYREFLRPDGYAVSHVETGQDALNWLSENHPDAILLDLMLPDMNGLDVLREIKLREISTEVMIVTAHGSVDIAVEAIRAGASDFLEKPFNSGRLRTSLSNILQKQRLVSEIEIYRREFTRDHYHGFVGGSLPMQAIYRIIESAAPSKAAVFITGETGTGKEVCAEAIHHESNRRAKPLVPINCAAIPKELMESEIFGHVKGAFTGAHNDRQGAAVSADGGTLFLDEICEMDLDLQSKLLRFIQTGTFQKVGSNKLEEVDIRIVCATNRDLQAEVQTGRFREDLYYRLHVIPIALPPLRERDEDILIIAKLFLERYSLEENKQFMGFTPEVEDILRSNRWPGNVRQLQNVIRNIVVLNKGELVTKDMLPSGLSSSGANEKTGSSTVNAYSLSGDTIVSERPSVQPLWLVEKRAIESTIEACNGNVPKAAAILEVSASTLYRKIQRWNTEGVNDETE
jgi:two-component system repressor protein LuxO